MGFFVIVLAAIVGIVLIIMGIAKAKGDRRWIALSCLGLLSFAFAVWLGWPK